MERLMQYGETEVQRFDNSAGALCLDFANTADWHARETPEELLRSYADLITWGQFVGVLTGERARHLLELATQNTSRAETVRHQAVTLREAIYRLFVAIINDDAINPQDIDIINAVLPQSLAHLRLVNQAETIEWGWQDTPHALDQILWPVARDAAKLLTSDLRYRVGQCEDTRGCGWLFIDTSRNHTRRWCSMDRCGNRAKAQRHYRRKKVTQQ